MNLDFISSTTYEENAQQKFTRELRKDIEDILYENLEQKKSSASEPPKKISKISWCYICPTSLQRESKTRYTKCS